jgi:hypothetical protein
MDLIAATAWGSILTAIIVIFVYIIIKKER